MIFLKKQNWCLSICTIIALHGLFYTQGFAQDTPLNIIVIGAHPDDADLCAGGTAAWWASMGHRVKFLSLTNGDAGHHEMGGGALAKRRRSEAKESGRRLGIEEYEVLDNHDGELIPSLDVRLQVIRRIRQWNADVVILPRPNDYHPDHRNTGLVVQDAAYMVIVPNVASDTPPLDKNPVFLYCQDRFQKPNPFEPDIAINLDPIIEKKIYALDAHTSQFYEWLPWTVGRLKDVPTDLNSRIPWLAQLRSRSISPAIANALAKWYGQESVNTIKEAEAFEICEYGQQPNEEKIAQLFPMLGKNNPTIKSLKTKSPIIIDGKLDEEIYRSKQAGVFLKNSMTKDPIYENDYSTYVQAFHDDSYLYLAYTCNDQDIHSSFSKRDEHLWEEEAVEVFIDVDNQPNDYVEIEVSPKNILYDSFIVDPLNIDVPATKKYNIKKILTEVSVNGTTRNRKDKDILWTVEVAIPFEELMPDYKPELLGTYKWKINFYRINRDSSPLKFMAWSPTEGSFHKPEKFGTIIFEE